STLRSLVLALARIAVLLLPYMPGKMTSLWREVAGDRPLPLLGDLPHLDPAGWNVSSGTVLFPRPDLVRCPASGLHFRTSVLDTRSKRRLTWALRAARDRRDP